MIYLNIYTSKINWEAYWNSMTIKIDYLSKANDKITANTVLFVDDKYNINNIQKHVTNSDFDYIKDLLKNSDLKKNILVQN